MKQIELKSKLYFVSSDGKVYDHKMNELPLRNHRGRKYFHRYSVHRLVARLYHPDFTEDCEVHHIDFLRTNNDISNLACLSKLEHSSLHKDDIILNPEEPKKPMRKKTRRAFNKKFHIKQKRPPNQ